jgi:Uma2 family endonuclease
MHALEREIAGLIDSDPLWSELNKAFRSVKGVADRTVARLMAQLPEIGLVSGKAEWELFDGAAVAMAPERARHGLTKTEAAFALREAARRAGAPCRAFAAGITVRVSNDRAFVPDALVVCPPPPEAVIIDNPLIVVEVLTPSTAAVDHGIKLEGYFSLVSLAHYLILDPDRRVVIHHRPGEAGVIETRILRDGALRLEPPGLEF